MTKKSCTCIIPFYNETFQQLKSIIATISLVENIEKIICVDDGSQNETVWLDLRNEYKEITVIRLSENSGKSAAIRAGLQHVHTPYVLLFDSDLQNVKKIELESALCYILENPLIDMLILRRISDPWFAKIIRGEILTSGERILKTHDLVRVYTENKPAKYQLEYAINFYCMKYGKKAYWYPCSGQNIVKIRKIGFVRGVKNEIMMYVDMLRYAGVVMPLKSLLLFCREDIRSARTI